ASLAMRSAAAKITFLAARTAVSASCLRASLRIAIAWAALSVMVAIHSSPPTGDTVHAHNLYLNSVILLPDAINPMSNAPNAVAAAYNRGMDKYFFGETSAWLTQAGLAGTPENEIF